MEPANNNLDYGRLVEGLKQGDFKRIVVITGPGIGIPDFRAKDNQ